MKNLIAALFSIFAFFFAVNLFAQEAPTPKTEKDEQTVVTLNGKTYKVRASREMDAPDDPPTHQTLQLKLPKLGEKDSGGGSFGAPIRGGWQLYGASTYAGTPGEEGPDFQILELRFGGDLRMTHSLAFRFEAGLGAALTQESSFPDYTGATAGSSAFLGFNFSPVEGVGLTLGIRDFLVYMPGIEDIANTIGGEGGIYYRGGGWFSGVSAGVSHVQYEVEEEVDPNLILPAGQEPPDPGSKIVGGVFLHASAYAGFSF